MKWDVWTQWNILIWAHSTFSHIDIPVAFGRLWVLSNVSIPLCWPRPNASLWRWMPWPFLWMRWGCLHRAFFRPYHVFSVTSLVPFKGQGKARSDLHTRRLNPFFFFPVVPKKGFGRLPKRKVCARIVQFAETFLAPKTPTEVIWWEFFEWKHPIFCATIWGGWDWGWLGLEVGEVFGLQSFFFGGFHLANWKELESSGKSRFWYGFRIRRMIHIILSWGGSIWYPSTKNEKNYFTSSDPHHDMLGGGCQVRVVIENMMGRMENLKTLISGFLGLVILVRWALVTMFLSWTTQTGCRIHRTYVSLIGSGEGRHTTHFLKCVLLLSTSQTDWKHIFWHSFWHIFRHAFWHIFWHSFWHIKTKT